MRSDWIVLGGVVLFGLFTTFKEPSSRTQPAPVNTETAMPVPPESSTAAELLVPWPQQPEPATYSAPEYRMRTFQGYTCTSDCSGHEAGYEWAEAHGLDDPNDCDGNSESFIEGCRSYAEEQEMIEEDDQEEEEE